MSDEINNISEEKVISNIEQTVQTEPSDVNDIPDDVNDNPGDVNDTSDEPTEKKHFLIVDIIAALKKTPDFVQIIISFLLLVAEGAALVIVLQKMGHIASGIDIYGHLYKCNYMYEQIKEGNFYPLYTDDWYNGIQPFRYWAPFPYYVVAPLIALCGGNVLNGYYAFTFFSIVVGGMGFVGLGKSCKRIPLGCAFGLLWFFMPENMRVFYYEGNLSRMVSSIIIPYLVWFLYMYLKNERHFALVGIMITIALITLSHAMVGAITGIGSFIFLLYWAIENKKLRPCINVLVSMLLGLLSIGIWLIPALSGGIVGMDKSSNETVMETVVFNLADSLNPMNRIDGVTDTFYYGIGILVVAILGIFLSPKKHRAGFLTAITILLLTTKVAAGILIKLPLAQILWFSRLGAFTYALVFFSLFSWKSLKKFFCCLVIVILFIDVVPSFNLYRYYCDEKRDFDTEVAEIQEVATQRVAIADLSTMASYFSYALNKGDKAVDYTYGWAWQGATTADNIVAVNDAIESGDYLFMFDRYLALGDDTVYINKEVVEDANCTNEDIEEAGKQLGYYFVKETEYGYIYHMDTPESFGVKTTYTGLCIGSYSSGLAKKFPNMEVADDDNLNSYTLDDLKDYKCIFLSGFTYDDKIAAEELIKECSDAGIRIVIDMTHVPVNEKTNRYEFCSVVMQDISFEDYYPDLYVGDSKYTLLPFSEEDSTWNTGYIEGVDNSTGTFTYGGKDLTFLGTKDGYDNVEFLGLNIAYHGSSTGDPTALNMIGEWLDNEPGQLPERTIVPITKTVDADGITITCDEDNVNTTLTYLDSFSSDEYIEDRHNLLYVNKGTTRIDFKYPMFAKGMAVTLLGLILSVLFLRFTKPEKPDSDDTDKDSNDKDDADITGIETT